MNDTVDKCPHALLRPTLKHRASLTAPGKPGFQRLQLLASATEKRVFQQYRSWSGVATNGSDRMALYRYRVERLRLARVSLACVLVDNVPIGPLSPCGRGLG